MRKKKKNECERLLILTQQIDKSLLRLKGLDESVREKKSLNVKEMIKYYRDLTDNIETRRATIRNSTVQVLAFSIAAIILMIVSKETVLGVMGMPTYYVVVAIFSSLIISALLINLLYTMQSTFKYPWKSLQSILSEGSIGKNQWKWFYYGNKDVAGLDSRLWSLRENKVGNCVSYLSGLDEFVEKYSSENSGKELESDVQQLYLLLTHNFYKNRFERQLNGLWKYTLFIVTILLILAVGLFFLNYPGNKPSREAPEIKAINEGVDRVSQAINKVSASLDELTSVESKVSENEKNVNIIRSEVEAQNAENKKMFKDIRSGLDKFSTSVQRFSDIENGFREKLKECTSQQNENVNEAK